MVAGLTVGAAVAALALGLPLYAGPLAAIAAVGVAVVVALRPQS
jgi:hypothetical protein